MTQVAGQREMRELARAVEAGAVVRALERVGFTQKTLAWATGANERSVLEEIIARLGATVLVLSPTAFGKLIAEDTQKWAKVIRAANIKPN